MAGSQHAARSGASAPDGAGLRDVLCRWRRRHGLTQRQAARAFRCSAGSWAGWEIGVVPNPATLRRLSAFVGVPLGDLRAAAGPDRVRRPQTCGDDATTPLAAARIVRGMSQTAVAARLCISVPTLSRWEAGEFRPHPGDYQRIAALFGRSTAEVSDWFVDYPERQSSSVGQLHGLRHEWRRLGHSDLGVAGLIGVDVERLRLWGTGRVGVPHDVWERLCQELGLDPVQDRIRLRPRPVVPAPSSMLARLRRQRGLTQQELGSRIGVSGSAIGSWESGRRRLPVSAARLLSLVLGCAPDELLDAEHHSLLHAVTAIPLTDRGGALRARRQQFGLSAAQLSRIVGVSPDTVRRWETNQSSPSATMTGRLEIAFGLRRGTLTAAQDAAEPALGQTEATA